MDREPEISSRLLHSLRDADRFSYAFCCEALAGFDVREQLGSITVPTQAVAGAQDAVAPPSFAEEVAAGITAGGGTATQSRSKAWRTWRPRRRPPTWPS